MSRHALLSLTLTVTLGLALAFATPALAQPGAPSSLPPTATTPRQVLSTNAYGLVLDFINAEYEIRGGEAVTFGAGASTHAVTVYDGYDYATRTSAGHEERYRNGDVFIRYYPGGQAFAGRSFGVKAGFTSIPSQGSYFGVGFDANQSWMLNDHFFFGTGLGLKRLIGTNDRSFDLKVIPTLRANIGLGF